MKKIILFCAVFLLAACEDTTNIRQNAGFADSWNKNYSIAMLPPTANINYVPLIEDDKPMPEEEAKTIAVLNREMPGILSAKHYQYHAANFAASPQLESLNKKTLAVIRKMYQGPQIETKDAFNIHESVGAEANVFATAAHADLLLFINYTGYEESSASYAEDFTEHIILTPLLHNARFPNAIRDGLVDVAIIDGDSGDILWTTIQDIKTLNEDSLQPGENPFSTPLGKALQDLPDKTGLKPVD